MIRTSVGKKFVVTMVCALLAFGCPTAQQWFQIAGALLPIIGQTYLQFYGFARGGADAGDVALVQNLTTAGQDIFSKVGGLIQTAQTNSNESVIAQINALLAQAKQDVDAFLNDAQIKNSVHFAEYSQFAKALLADIQDVLSLVPVLVPVPVSTVPGHAAPGKVVALAPMKRASALKGVFQERLASLPK